MSSPEECFDAENITRATSGLGQLRSRNQQAIKKVLEQVSNNQLQFSSMFLTHICHGISHGKLVTEIPAAITEQVMRDLTVFTNDDLFTLLYCYSNRETRNGEICQRFYDEVNSREVKKFEDADFAIILESFAKWKHPVKQTELGEKMVKELESRPLHGFATMELSIILERLEYTNPDYFEHFQKELAKRSDYDAVAGNQLFESDMDDDDGDDNKPLEDIVVTEQDLEDYDDEDFEEDDDDEEEKEEEKNKAEEEEEAENLVATSKLADSDISQRIEGEQPVSKELKPNFRRFRRRLTQ